MKKLSALIRLLRPMQWTKNAFVLAPLIFSFKLTDASSVVSGVFAFVVFCLLASAVYVANDIMDVEADRKHPRKQRRPLAAGSVTILEAKILLALLFIVGAVLVIYGGLNYMFLVFTGLYVVFNTAYIAGLKHIALLELFIVAAGYVLRLLAGCAAIHEAPSPWILAATGAIALLIVAGKRRDEMIENHGAEHHRRSLRGYNLAFLDSMIGIMAAVTLVTYLLFTTSDYAIERYHSPYFVSTSVFVLYGVLRYMQLVKVKGGAEDPTSLILTDRSLCVTVGGWLLCCIGLIYFNG